MNTSQCDSEEQAVGPDRNFVGLPGSGGAAPLPRPDEEYAALLNERKRAQNAIWLKDGVALLVLCNGGLLDRTAAE